MTDSEPDKQQCMCTHSVPVRIQAARSKWRGADPVEQCFSWHAHTVLLYSGCCFGLLHLDNLQLECECLASQHGVGIELHFLRAGLSCKITKTMHKKGG